MIRDHRQVKFNEVYQRESYLWPCQTFAVCNFSVKVVGTAICYDHTYFRGSQLHLRQASQSESNYQSNGNLLAIKQIWKMVTSITLTNKRYRYRLIKPLSTKVLLLYPLKHQKTSIGTRGGKLVEKGLSNVFYKLFISLPRILWKI